MKILDIRKEKYINFDAVKFIKKIIGVTPNKFFIGIDKIVLLDTDYTKRGIAGRWLKRKNKLYEIEIMFDSIDNLPDNLRENEIALSFKIANTLFHEIYHHYISFLSRKESKKFEDEYNAEEFGIKHAIDVIKLIYSQTELLEFKEKHLNFL